TGDKDLAQLVNSHVTLVNTMSGEVLDEPGVQNKFGVAPDRIVDYLMLIGDTVDNIPGVTKVGPKTAAKWLGEFGSIDALVEQADTIKGVAGNNLREAIAQFPLTRELLTVKCDCDLLGQVNTMADLEPRQPDIETLQALYERYGFRTWLREVTGDAERVPQGDARVIVEAPAAPAELRYQIITGWAAFDEWLARIAEAPLVALDTETTSRSEARRAAKRGDT